MWGSREKNLWNHSADNMALGLGPHVAWLLWRSLDLALLPDWVYKEEARGECLSKCLKLLRGDELAEWSPILKMKDLDVENGEALLLGMWEWSPPGDWMNTKVLGQVLAPGIKGKSWGPSTQDKALAHSIQTQPLLSCLGVFNLSPSWWVVRLRCSLNLLSAVQNVFHKVWEGPTNAVDYRWEI